MMAFIFGLPVAQIILFCISIGKDPVGLRLAIVNNELNSSADQCIPSVGCDWSLLSCRYLQHLQKRTVVFLPCNSEEEGRDAVKKGMAWATLTFPSNYSASLMARIDDGRNAADWDVEYAEFQVTMDMSSKSMLNFKCNMDLKITQTAQRPLGDISGICLRPNSIPGTFSVDLIYVVWEKIERKR